MAGPAPIIGLPGRLPLDAALEAAIGNWGAWLAHERRLSPHTLAAYGRDLVDFLEFLTMHVGGPLTLATLDDLTTADFRAWLSARFGRGLARSSTARALSRSISSTWFRRVSEMTPPSDTGTDPPERPVPAPRATNGISKRLQRRTASCT